MTPLVVWYKALAGLCLKHPGVGFYGAFSQASGEETWSGFFGSLAPLNACFSPLARCCYQWETLSGCYGLPSLRRQGPNVCPLHHGWSIIGPSIRWDLRSLIHLISRLGGILQAVSRPTMSRPGLDSIIIDLPTVTYIRWQVYNNRV